VACGFATGRPIGGETMIALALTVALALALAIPAGFASIFNGRDLSGWHISQNNHHGKTKSWHVDNGVLIGSQDPVGEGGILLTDRKYRDFEVYLEINPDFGCDGGLFLRSNEAGQAYQVMIDYLDGGSVGGIYGEGLQGVTGTTAAPWTQHWRKGEWNSLRVRIEGDVPHIIVWLNGAKVTDWKDSANHAANGATEGMIALQVHGGSRWVRNGQHRFRNIAVKSLDR
jgi:3-keto-disaccharide hydrolase